MRPYLIIKRGFDFVFSLLMIVFLSPIFLVIIALIKLNSPGPIIFKQKRIGQNKVPFYIYKFRTMFINTPKDVPTHLLDQPDQWITKVGRFLRKSSLDELPQLFNILQGKMSFIGPRPALWNQYDLIDLRDKYQVNSLYPGLTGWAQVNGRDELSIQEKVNYDYYYFEHVGILLDLKCLFNTLIKVVRSENIKEGTTREI